MSRRSCSHSTATFVVDELKMVRAALDLREMHLLGHERASIVTRRTQPPMIPSTCSLSASTTRRYVCRVQPLPEHVKHSVMKINETVYGTMLGAEWNITGNLAGWDVTDRLRELDLPVLSPQVATTR